VAVPTWVKQGIEAWTAAAKIDKAGRPTAFEVGKDRLKLGDCHLVGR
jgi:hypothetical protein